MNALQRKHFADKYANNFVETSVTEATPHKLVEMLYQGVLRHAKVAKVFIESKNYEKKAFHINKALAIVAGLKSGVNLEMNEEVAGNFYDLYDFCYRSLFEASRNNDVTKIQDVIDIIQDLSDAWQQMPSDLKEAEPSQIKRMAMR